ncbi:MAG: hypothetical protein ACI8SE_000970 [Bacteroidia bacterium]|jgi:hypothetical protein
MLLNGLDVSYNSIDTSKLAKQNLKDTSSFANKAVRIFDEINSEQDISPEIISESVLRNINIKDFDFPLY